METLTKGQEEALGAIKAFLLGSEANHFVLKGFAGTGKTFLTKKILKEARGRVVLAAPTNKAARVLSQKTSAPTETLFKVLGLRMSLGEVRQGPPRALEYCDLLIVDEASMVNKHDLDLAHEYAALHGFKVLWIGDPAQLPPVGEEESQAFLMGAPSFTLDQIVRQEKGNKILEASIYLRQCLDSGTMPDPRALPFDGSSLFALQRSAKEALEQSRSKGLKTVGLGFTNAIVNNLANENTPLEVGESVTPVFRACLMIDGYVKQIYSGADILEIKALEEGPPVEGVECDRVLFEGDPSWYNVPKKPSITATLKRKVKAQILGAQRALLDFEELGAADLATEKKKEIRGLARTLEGLEVAYTELRRVKATTIHKSQGSTFQDVIIDWHDVQKAGDPKLVARLLYVAITRASGRAFICFGK